MAAKRIFVSYDYTKERSLKNAFVTQAKEQGLQIRDFSLEEDHRDPQWEEKAKLQIRQCNLVVVLIGEDTHDSDGIRKEVAIANGFQIPIIQIRNKRARTENYGKTKGAGKEYPWKWTVLNPLLR